MTEDELKTLRVLLREEVNAAVYASEQRMGERFGRLDDRTEHFEGYLGRLDDRTEHFGGHLGRLDDRMEYFEGYLGRIEDRMEHFEGYLGRIEDRMEHFEDHMEHFEGHLGRLDQRVDRLEDQYGQVEISQQKMQVDLSHVVAILNEVTKTINSIQAAQIALELKVEDNSRSLKRDMQNLTDIVHTFAYRFVDANGQTSERLILHERTPIDHAHPRPNSTT